MPGAKYDQSMNARITVSLPEDLVAAAHAAVADGRAASVSAYVAGALRETSERESLGDVLAEWRLELGPPTDEEEAWVQDALAAMRMGRG